MAIWRLMSSHHDPTGTQDWSREAADRYLREGFIAIGWQDIGDLRQYKTLPALAAALKEKYGYQPNHATAPIQLWRFQHEMKEGDLVIISALGGRRAVMQVTGPYEFTPDAHDKVHLYPNRRPTKLTHHNADDLWNSCQGVQKGDNIRWTLVRCSCPAR